MSEQFNRIPLGFLFRNMREEKGLLIRQVAAVTELDQAIISHIENGSRLPTKEQVIKLAGLYNLDIKETMSAWLAERMVRDYGDEPYVTEAFREAHDRVMFNLKAPPNLFFDTPRLYNLTLNDTNAERDPKGKPGRKKKNPNK